MWHTVRNTFVIRGICPQENCLNFFSSSFFIRIGIKIWTKKKTKQHQYNGYIFRIFLLFDFPRILLVLSLTILFYVILPAWYQVCIVLAAGWQYFVEFRSYQSKKGYIFFFVLFRFVVFFFVLSMTTYQGDSYFFLFSPHFGMQLLLFRTFQCALKCCRYIYSSFWTRRFSFVKNIQRHRFPCCQYIQCTIQLWIILFVFWSSSSRM